MNLPESEKYYLECFDKTINTDGCVIANPEEITKYGQICRLEGEIEMLEKFYKTEMKTMIDEKKKQLKEIYEL